MKPPKGTTSRYSGWSLAKSRIGELADLPQIYSKLMAKHHSTWILKVRFYKLGEPWALVSWTSSFRQSVRNMFQDLFGEVREAVRLGWLAHNQSTSHILWGYLIPKQLSLLELHLLKVNNLQPKFPTRWGLNPGTPGLSGFGILRFGGLQCGKKTIGDMNGMVMNDVKMMCMVVKFDDFDIVFCEKSRCWNWLGRSCLKLDFNRYTVFEYRLKQTSLARRCD